MTFSISGWCERTGMVGVAITTSSICVGARCPWVRAGVGAVASQNLTDPALGKTLLSLLDDGASPAEAVELVVAQKPHIEHRQLAVVDARGRTASFSGARMLGTHAVSEGKHCVGAGNLLADAAVAGAMTDRFAADVALHLAERLLRSLQAGLGAGGEVGTVHSAALKVAERHPWPLVDLRVDWDDGDPVGALARLWRAYEPQMADYVIRAVDPDAAPSYGVPGDP